jgi:cytidylate kinase
MLVLISGFAGSGKSSLADSLGKALGLKVVHASAILREMAVKGVKALDNASHEKIHDWWESEEAKEFMKRRNKDGSLDLELDKKLIEIASKGNVILDSWTMPYLYKGNALRIWLNASPETRAKRVASRDNLDYKVVLNKIIERDNDTKALYQRLYNFRMGENQNLFDLIINTDNLTQEEVFKKTMAFVRKWFDGKSKIRNKRP